MATRTRRQPNRFLQVAPKAFPLQVRVHAMHVEEWLRTVQAYRQQLSPDERRDALLWSWPVRRAMTPAAPPHPWRWGGPYDDERLTLGARVSAGLERLAREWYPFCTPQSLDDIRFQRRCRDLYNGLVELGVVSEDVPPLAVEGFLAAHVLEPHWGDGEYEARQEQLTYARKKIGADRWLPVIRILEGARDHAFLFVQASGTLRAMRNTKKDVTAFLDWLRDASRQEDFVQTHLSPDAQPTNLSDLFGEPVREFCDAYQRILECKRAVRTFLEEGVAQGLDSKSRYQREQAGRPLQVWVDTARRELTRLRIPNTLQLDLLRACALLRPERG